MSFGKPIKHKLLCYSQLARQSTSAIKTHEILRDWWKQIKCVKGNFHSDSFDIAGPDTLLIQYEWWLWMRMLLVGGIMHIGNEIRIAFRTKEIHFEWRSNLEVTLSRRGSAFYCYIKVISAGFRRNFHEDALNLLRHHWLNHHTQGNCWCRLMISLLQR